MNRINYTDEGETSVQPEVNKKRTGLRWKALDPKTLKFVDDDITLTKMCMDSVPPCLEGARPVRDKHDVQTQNLFRRVVARAESRGMVVNKKKTKILCVSDAQTYSAASHFYDADGTKLQSGKSMISCGLETERACAREGAWSEDARKVLGPASPQESGIHRGGICSGLLHSGPAGVGLLRGSIPPDAHGRAGPGR